MISIKFLLVISECFIKKSGHENYRNDHTRQICLIIGSLSSDVFERRMSTGSGLFALLSRVSEQIFGQIVFIIIKTLGNKTMVASRLIKREKGSLPVDVRRSKTSLLKLPILSTSPYYFCRNWIGTANENSNFDLRA